MKTYYVYIMASKKKYGFHKLVWYESCNSIESAIDREKDIKRWYRRWKLKLIEDMNPLWEDLFEKING